MLYNYRHQTHTSNLQTHAHSCTVKVLFFIILSFMNLFKSLFGFFSLITMQRSRMSILANFAFFPFLFFCIVTSRDQREAAIAQFLFKWKPASFL